MKIIDIQGIGPALADKLSRVGIRSTEALLKEGATPDGRKKISESTGINHDSILKWVNHADLYRIKGIGSEYSELLEEAGVDTVVELAHRNAENLFATMQAKNEEKKLVRRLPTQKQVEAWIAEAKQLPKM